MGKEPRGSSSPLRGATTAQDVAGSPLLSFSSAWQSPCFVDFSRPIGVTEASSELGSSVSTFTDDHPSSGYRCRPGLPCEIVFLFSFPLFHVFRYDSMPGSFPSCFQWPLDGALIAGEWVEAGGSSIPLFQPDPLLSFFPPPTACWRRDSISPLSLPSLSLSTSSL